jgi:hypothetical protein
MRIRQLLILPLIVLSGCLGLLSPDVEVPKLTGTFRVLFIGNSHTYENNVPAMVQAIARQWGNYELQTAKVAFPNFALEDHAYEGTALKALQGSDWEYVVLQQGTSAAPSSQEHLRGWSMWWAPHIAAANAEPVMYQIWPHVSRRFDAPAALSSYAGAAIAIDALLAPAGDGLTAALDSNADIRVYSGDGLHASRRGAYVAALTIVARLLPIDVELLPPEIPGSNDPELVVRELQRAAARALARNPARPATPVIRQ